MKNLKWIASSLVMIALVATIISGCKKDEKTFDLSTLTAGGVDLNGASSATGIPVDANIIATFSDDVDASTANSSNITLTKDFDNSNVALTITVSGKTITIDPQSDLGTGSLYKLNISAGVKSGEGVASSAISRTFTTSGTFAPSDYIAYWSFDEGSGNPQDATGNFNASSVTNITYVDAHNSLLGKAIQFDGSTSLVQVPNGAGLENSSAFSLSFWIYGDSVGHTNASGGLKGNFVMGAGFFRGFEIEMGAKFDYAKLGASYSVTGAATPTLTNDFFFNGDGMNKDNGGWQGIVTEADLTSSGGPAGLLAEKWAHFVVTFDAATELRSMYINGQLMETDDYHLWPDGDPFQTCTGLMFEPGATDLGPNFVFGFASDPSSTFWADTDFGNYANPDANHFKGMLDDVRIYHRALTQDEITAMYNSSK